MKSVWFVALTLLSACSGNGTVWVGAQIVGDSAGGTSGVGKAGAGNEADSAGPLRAFFARYEAESPVNDLTYPVESVVSKGSAPCPTDGVEEGANCSSGGEFVELVLGRSPCNPPTSPSSYDGCQNKGGGIRFNEITVPVDASYDVTWWYHCGSDSTGHANVYGDTGCGGLDYQTGPGSGCRPHLIDVNGVPMSAARASQTALYYQFPCYTSAWNVLHGATTSLPLKAGTNTIYLHAPGATMLDAADIDALDVQAAGSGTAPPPLWPKLVTPVVSPN